MKHACIAVLIIVMLFIVVPEKRLGAGQTGGVEYPLARPGMLPDNPLYRLKVLRDKIVFRFIRKPVKKLEFYLLQTDRGISASLLLIEKKNIRLAQETALKAEHNYTQLVSNYKWMYWYAMKIPKELREKIITAGLKHQEVLEVMANRVPEKDRAVFFQVKEFSRRNLEELEMMIDNVVY